MEGVKEIPSLLSVLISGKRLETFTMIPFWSPTDDPFWDQPADIKSCAVPVALINKYLATEICQICQNQEMPSLFTRQLGSGEKPEVVRRKGDLSLQCPHCVFRLEL